MELTRLMLISPVFLAAGAIVSAILNTEDRFGAAALAPVAYNICIIVFALLLSVWLGVFAAALGVVAGSVAHLLVQIPALRRVFHYSLRADVERSRGRASPSGSCSLERSGMGANQMTFLVNTALASTLAVGAVVSYNVAFNVLQIPLGVIGLPLGIVLLPALSRALARGEDAEFGQTVGRARSDSCSGPCSWSPPWASSPATRSWSFSSGGASTRWRWPPRRPASGSSCSGLPAHALNVILARAFYSGRDTVTPVSVAVASVVINVVVSVVTIDRLGLEGLALGIAVGAWFEAVALTLLLGRRHPAVLVRSVVSGGAASLVGALAAGLAAAIVLAVTPVPPGLTPALGLLLGLTVATAAALVVYLAYSRLMRLPELPRTVGLLRSARRPG